MRVDPGVDSFAAAGSADPSARCLVPYVDGTSLVDLIAAYEADGKFDVVGGYGGVESQRLELEDFRPYYLGSPTSQMLTPGKAWLLGCDCGELGCWPLEATIATTPDLVIWSRFRQPHRPGRDYTGFGPFRFAREQYAAAIDEALEQLRQA